MKILYHTIYESNPNGHGGEKRTSQINEILSDNKIKYASPVYSNKWSITSILKIIIFISHTFGIYRIKSIKAKLKFLITFATQISSLDKFLLQDGKLLVWESTKDIFYYLPIWAKKRNKNIIAIPHNLESLVPSQKSLLTGKSTPYGFNLEIDIFKKCEAVFCISREETFMLKLFGINAFYLPYYPTREVEQHLLSIREKRKIKEQNAIKQLLLMGSAINPPTRIGMESRIRFFEHNKIENTELRVGGFGTEVLQKSIINTHQIKLLGELTSEQLDTELLNTDALLIHQPATTGALTRIIEMLLAGIPVILNEDSARSYFGMDGIAIYENDLHLLEIIGQHLPIPRLPIRPDYSVFINTVKSLI